MLKKCTRCNLYKDESNFYNNKNHKDGKEYQCIECYKNYVKINKEHRKIIQKNYRIKNKDKIKDYYKTPQYKSYAKKIYEKNRDNRLKYIENNKDIIKEKRKVYYLNNKELFLVRSYILLDKKKNRLCDLTVEWMKENITSKPCIYCGDTENIGCDRIDNTKGHTMNNCVPCCTQCNLTRGDRYSFTEMILLGKTIKIIKSQR